MTGGYDAIVVGARCGSPAAMLLAPMGYRVLLVDKAAFPSDTMSTHLAHPPAVAALARWGILERLEDTNCPPITRYSFDFGPVTVSGSPLAADGAARAYCPRRIVLDALLVEAAVAAGAELREDFTVEEIVVDDGRVTGIRGHAKRGQTVAERSTTRSPGDAPTTRPWPTTSAPATPRRGRSTSSPRVRDDRAPAARDAAAHGREARQPGSHGRLRQRHGGHPAPEFFGPENAGRIMAQAAT